MKRFFLLFTAMTVVFCAGLVSGGEPDGVSSVLLPAGRSDVRSVHHLHDASKIPCAKCHQRATFSRWASDRLVPDMEICAECHKQAQNVTIVTAVTKACRICHNRLKPGQRPVRAPYPRPNIRFSHKAHGNNTGCGKCHKNAAAGTVNNPGRDIAVMGQCYNCHQQKKASTACRSCHLANHDGRLLTEFSGTRLTPPTWLIGPNHGHTWVQHHASTAGRNSALCGSCHRESFCQDCHTGRLRPRNVHPGDWMAAHGVSTRLDNPRCRGCHRKQSFCITCHRRSGVAPDSPENSMPAGGPGRYHKGMTASKLMRRAKYDIAACVSCHNEGSCISCHKRPDLKPHPPGFKHKCQSLATRNRRACAKCHRDDVWHRCK